MPPTITNGDPALNDKLKRVQADLAEFRSKRQAEQKSLENSERLAAGNTNSPAAQAAQYAQVRIGKLDSQIDALQERQHALLGQISNGGGGAGGPFAIGAAPVAPMLHGWDVDNVLTDQTRHFLATYAASTMPAGGRVPLGQVIDRDALAASLGSFGGSPMAAAIDATDNMRRGTYIGVAPQLRRPLSLLDLIPTSTMDGKSVPYTQESGSFDTAAETAEGALKPEAGITLTDAEAVAATIPHYLKVFKQTLADAPSLQSTLEGRLRYGVMRRLQNACLIGDGVGANLRGILNTSGIGAVAYAAGELPADQILRGLTNVHLAEGQPNAIVVNPFDWQTVLMAKATGGDEQYYSGGPFAVTNEAMWMTPLIPSTAIPQGTVLVGDFAMGAHLFIREGVNVLISDSDQDDFLRNIVTLLAEMRAAFAVFRPAVFTTVDIAP